MNIRTFSLNFGLREGDEDDFNWIEGQMFGAQDQEEFEAFATGSFLISISVTFFGDNVETLVTSWSTSFFVINNIFVFRK